MSQTVSDDEGARTDERGEPANAPLVHPGMGLLFVVLIGCFTAWGIAADLTTPMVAGFKNIFEMSTFQASLVQLAYFGAYFLLALPAAFINERFGYKVGCSAASDWLRPAHSCSTRPARSSLTRRSWSRCSRWPRGAPSWRPRPTRT